MTGYERVKRAMHFQSVDKVPLRYVYRAAGYYEHGDKLNDLFATLPGDFDEFQRIPPTGPRPEDLDENGNYHSFQQDEWGTVWEYRLFGVGGIAHGYPIGSPEDIETYSFPAPPALEGPDFEAFAQSVRRKKERGLYAMMPWCMGLYERLIALYGDENVFCDMFMNEAGINKLADGIVEYNAVHMERAIKAGCDAVFLGDDYGTERSLIMGPDCWRRFIKPRLKRLFQPAVNAGVDVHFHSCGYIAEILPDLREVGVTSIWPQIPAYDMEQLAETCRELGLAVEVHTDRAHTMTHGTPQQVRDLVKREVETFRMPDGGAWLYVEVDSGFPYANVEALIETIAEYR